MLRDADLDNFAKLGIGAAMLEAAGIERVGHDEAKDRFGISCSGDRAGIVFPYFDPETGQRVTARLRRDNPEIEGGKPTNKYVSAYADRRHLYFPSNCVPLLADAAVPVVIVEAEKSTLAGMEWAARNKRPYLFIGTGGCWGWRGRIGITETPKGQRVEEKGPLPDLELIAWKGRETIIAFDANSATNSKVRRARWTLAEELAGRGARVRFANIPPTEGVIVLGSVAISFFQKSSMPRSCFLMLRKPRRLLPSKPSKLHSPA
jgi:hypothetical protein